MNELRPFVSASSDPRAFLEACLGVLGERESEIGAFVHLNLDAARAAADASTQRRRAGRPLSAIDGIPIGIKDIIETADLPTEMGSPLFRGWRSGRDAASVAALREAGAVIVGKTVTTEFAATFPGGTRNPWDPARTPGGSSSGSAAAVGSGMLAAALGTQVIGSILRPASYCGCFGYKPSVGGINRGGSVDYLSQSCAGVLAASLDDAWQVARAISARAGGDPGYPGISGPLTTPGARRPRALAVLETTGWERASAEAKNGLAELVARIRAAGIEVLDRRSDALVEAVEAAILPAMPVSRDINAWEFRWPLNTFARDMDRAGLSTPMQERLQQAEAMTLEQYQDLLRERDRVRAVYGGLSARCEGAITLAAPGAAPLGLASTGDPIFAVPSSFLGIPAISLPLLADGGLPVGVQLAGFQDADAALFAVAGWLWEFARAAVR